MPDAELAFQMRGVPSGMPEFEVISETAGRWTTGLPIQPERWACVVYTYDGAGNEVVYINGSKATNAVVRDVALAIWQAANLGTGLYGAVQMHDIALDGAAVSTLQNSLGQELGLDFSYPAPGFDRPIEGAQKQVYGTGFDADLVFDPTENTYSLFGTGAGGRFGGFNDSGVFFHSNPDLNESFVLEARFEWVGSPTATAQVGWAIRRQIVEDNHRTAYLLFRGDGDIERVQRLTTGADSTVTPQVAGVSSAWLKIENYGSSRSYRFWWKQNEEDAYQEVGTAYVDDSTTYNRLRRNPTGGNGDAPTGGGDHTVGLVLAGAGGDATAKVSGIRLRIALPDIQSADNASVEIFAGNYHTGLSSPITGYSMSGAPAGLMISATSGLIAGTIAAGQGSPEGTTYPIDVTYTTDDPATVTIRFDLVVFAGAPSPSIDPGNPSFTTNQILPISDNVITNFADNGLGTGTAGLSVSSVNGSDLSVGQQVTLGSGALITLNADGSFTYDPNGAFLDSGGNDSCTYVLTNGQGTADGVVNFSITAATTFFGTLGLDPTTDIGSWWWEPLGALVPGTQNCIKLSSAAGLVKTFTYDELGSNPAAAIEAWRTANGNLGWIYVLSIYLQRSGAEIVFPLAADGQSVCVLYSNILFGGYARIGLSQAITDALIVPHFREKVTIPLAGALTNNSLLVGLVGTANYETALADRQNLRIEYPTDPNNIEIGRWDNTAGELKTLLHDAGTVRQFGGGQVEDFSLAPYAFTANIPANDAGNSGVAYYRGSTATLGTTTEPIAIPVSTETPSITFDGTGDADGNGHCLGGFVVLSNVPAGDLAKQQAICDWMRTRYLDNVQWITPAPPPPPPDDNFQEDLSTYQLQTAYANPLTQAAVNAFDGTNDGPDSHILWQQPGGDGNPFVLHQLWSVVPGTNTPYPLSANQHRSETIMRNTGWDRHFQDSRVYVWDGEAVVHISNLLAFANGTGRNPEDVVTHLFQVHSRPTGGRDWLNPPFVLDIDANGALYIKIFRERTYDKALNDRPVRGGREAPIFPPNRSNSPVIQGTQLNQVFRIRVEYKVSTVTPTDAYVRAYLNGTKFADTGSTYLGWGWDAQPNLFGKIGLYAPDLTNLKTALRPYNDGYFAVGWRKFQHYWKAG